MAGGCSTILISLCRGRGRGGGSFLSNTWPCLCPHLGLDSLLGLFLVPLGWGRDTPGPAEGSHEFPGWAGWESSEPGAHLWMGERGCSELTSLICFMKLFALFHVQNSLSSSAPPSPGLPTSSLSSSSCSVLCNLLEDKPDQDMSFPWLPSTSG